MSCDAKLGGAIAVIGLGSMGKRRIRLLREIDGDLEVLGVDGRADRRDEAAALGARCTESIEGLGGDVRAACVCTPPLTHAQVTAACLERGWDVFSEINLVADGYGRNSAEAAARGLKLFLSSTFLYRAEVGYIREAISGERGAYRYHVGQYLPDWHPWEDYRDFFVADARTSGVRELLAIELPWLTSLYGPVKSFHVEKSKMSDLEVSYQDTVLLTLVHSSGIVGSLVVDVVSRRPVRDFEFFSEGCYLTWGGTSGSLEELDFGTGEMRRVDLYGEGGAAHEDGYAAFVVEDAYRRELECFLDYLSGGPTPEYGFAEDKVVLALVDEIERA